LRQVLERGCSFVRSLLIALFGSDVLPAFLRAARLVAVRAFVDEVSSQFAACVPLCNGPGSQVLPAGRTLKSYVLERCFGGTAVEAEARAFFAEDCRDLDEQISARAVPFSASAPSIHGGVGDSRESMSQKLARALAELNSEASPWSAMNSLVVCLRVICESGPLTWDSRVEIYASSILLSCVKKPMSKLRTLHYLASSGTEEVEACRLFEAALHHIASLSDQADFRDNNG